MYKIHGEKVLEENENEEAEGEKTEKKKRRKLTLRDHQYLVPIYRYKLL